MSGLLEYGAGKLYQRLDQSGTCDGYIMVRQGISPLREVIQRDQSVNIASNDHILGLGKKLKGATVPNGWVWISFYHLRARNVVWIREDWLTRQSFHEL